MTLLGLRWQAIHPMNHSASLISKQIFLSGTPDCPELLGIASACMGVPTFRARPIRPTRRDLQRHASTARPPLHAASHCIRRGGAGFEQGTCRTAVTRVPLVLEAEEEDKPQRTGLTSSLPSATSAWSRNHIAPRHRSQWSREVPLSLACYPSFPSPHAVYIGLPSPLQLLGPCAAAPALRLVPLPPVRPLAIWPAVPHRLAPRALRQVQPRLHRPHEGAAARVAAQPTPLPTTCPPTSAWQAAALGPRRPLPQPPPAAPAPMTPAAAGTQRAGPHRSALPPPRPRAVRCGCPKAPAASSGTARDHSRIACTIFPTAVGPGDLPQLVQQHKERGVV